MKWKRIALLLCPSKRDTHKRPVPENLCPNWERFDEEFYGSGSEVRLLMMMRMRVCAEAPLL